MRAKLVNEKLNQSKFVSKFRPGMEVVTSNNTYYIKKVEDHSYKYDLVYVIDKNGKKKLLASDWLEENGTIITKEKEKLPRMPRLPVMTTKKYERELKSAVDGLKQTLDDEEDPFSYINDSAESMLYDESLFRYLYRKYKKLYDENPRYRRDLIELLANDMTNIY